MHKYTRRLIPSLCSIVNIVNHHQGDNGQTGAYYEYSSGNNGFATGLIPQNNLIVQNQNSADCDQDHDHSKDNNGHGSQGALGNYNQNKQNQKDVKLE